MDPNRRALDVAGRSLPVLPFPLIHVHPHGVAVGAHELRVDVDERLRPVVARRQIAKALDRIAGRRAVDVAAAPGASDSTLTPNSGTPLVSACWIGVRSLVLLIAT